MRRSAVLLAGSLLLGATQPAAQPADASRTIAAVRAFASSQGERLWPRYGAAPFDILLIEPDRETLLCRRTAPQGFAEAGQDTALPCPRFTRPRSGLSDELLAAMPLFGPPATIVMGTPRGGETAVRRWFLTVLHEHFHQWQWSLPDYWNRAAALDLSGGDQTGMWMLNFPFPYDRPDVVASFRRAATALERAVAARGRPDFSRRLNSYIAARTLLARSAGERNWRYMELQLWQEGVARWTEIQLGRRHPDAAIQAEAATREQTALRTLREADLAEQKRLIAYPYGMAEAMLLEACGPGWRTRYPQLLALGPLLLEAGRHCRTG